MLYIPESYLSSHLKCKPLRNSSKTTVIAFPHIYIYMYTYVWYSTCKYVLELRTLNLASPTTHDLQVRVKLWEPPAAKNCVITVWVNDHITLSASVSYLKHLVLSENPPHQMHQHFRNLKVDETWSNVPRAFVLPWGLWVFLSEHVPEALQPGDTLLSYAPWLCGKHQGRGEQWNFMINVYIYTYYIYSWDGVVDI